MNRFASMLLWPLLTLALAAQEKTAYPIPYDEIKQAAQRFLDVKIGADAQAKLNKKLLSRVKQKVEDSGTMTDDAAMRSIMLDWAADNQGKIRKKEEPTIIQACFYFVKFQEMRFDMPWQFREQLDEKACTEILTYLREETDKAKAK